ncbi:MAG: hypothetical protein JSU07_06100 [Bacteroidetes bacterium]|nr:hypothetical protein [Bacteroidota bacterium]
MRGLFTLVLFLYATFLFSQKNVQILTKKYAPLALQEDLELAYRIIIKMHPSVGLYQTKEFIENEFATLDNEITDSLTEKQFRIKLKLIIDKLHCGHTDVMASKKYNKAIKNYKLKWLPYLITANDNKIYVVCGLNSKKDTILKAATQITKLNGITSDSIIHYCKKMITDDGYIETGKDNFLIYALSTFYPALFGRPDSILIHYLEKNKEKNTWVKTVLLNNLPALPINPKTDSTLTKYRNSKIAFKYIDKKRQTFYLKIASFSHLKYKKAYRKLFKKLQKNKSENLIIDLRNNGGGSIANSYRLLSYLINEPMPQTLVTGIKSYPYKHYTSGNFWFKSMRLIFKLVAKHTVKNNSDFYTYKIIPRVKNKFNGKVYVLINGGSFSASCLVSAYLKYKNRAYFIGEESGGTIAGCNAGIMPIYVLPNSKIQLRVPAFRVNNDIWGVESGRGIQPDIPINYTIADRLLRKDLELEKVKSIISKTIEAQDLKGF